LHIFVFLGKNGKIHAELSNKPMIKIRLSKGGVKNDPFYRIVAIEHHRKNTGKSLAVLGYWHPRKNEYKLDKKGIDVWVKNGGQISAAVKKLMDKK
jgi:small subunit ribosomal protein S16